MRYPMLFMSHTTVADPTQGKRVLVADDEPGIARLVQVTLEHHGYVVTCARDGQEAYAALRDNPFDLAILDVMMPYLDGFSVLKSLRTEFGVTKMPVIMLTAKTADADIYRSYQFGADLYLPKPFDPSELLSFVGRLC